MAILPTVALSLGAIFFLGVAGFVFRHRGGVGANALMVFLLAAGFWSILHGAEFLIADPQRQEMWGDIKYLGVVAIPPSILVFAVQYTGRRSRLGPFSFGLLMVEPLVVLALLFNPSTHDLVRSVPDDAPYGAYFPSIVGPVFVVHAAYSYALVVVAMSWLIIVLLRVSKKHRLRAWALIIICSSPLVLNIAYILRVIPLKIDPTPFAFSIAALVLVWGFFRFRLNELVPVGRRQVVDRIPDAVLVLDTQGRVMDANPAAARLTGQVESALVGRDVIAVLPQLRALADGTPVTQQAAGTCRVRTGAGVDLDLAVTVSPLPDDRSDPTGRLVVLRDITVQRDVERRLRELVRERSATIETLRRGLYPVNMPAIPGVQVAAVLDPAEAETSIGGDFWMFGLWAVGRGR
ncbi:MAG: histidine kinase N-terminal 7TM domain-containing protein [Angustibacter sp.]